MSKFLKITFPAKCIGCELCIHEVQRQFKKIGNEGSLIRILKDEESSSKQGKIKFRVAIDPQIQSCDVEKISEICPTGVFTIEEGDSDELIN